VNKNKLAVIGQSGNLTPADKKIYSLRDVTATVNSIPLIASSIMSKKLASGADAIVLDVKTGAGAFMENIQDAKKLAESMVSIGNLNGKKTTAIISDMNQPLGNAVGNALEIKEAIETLQGKGPKDLTEICLTLGSHMVVLAHQEMGIEEARNKLKENLMNGKAFEKFKLFLRAQGGDVRVADQPELLPQAKFSYDLVAQQSGMIEEITANEIGKVALMLGAGRTTRQSTIDLSVGLYLHKKIGDEIKKGEALLTIYSNTKSIHDVKEKLYQSIKISNKKITPPDLIHETITSF